MGSVDWPTARGCRFSNVKSLYGTAQSLDWRIIRREGKYCSRRAWGMHNASQELCRNSTSPTDIRDPSLCGLFRSRIPFLYVWHDSKDHLHLSRCGKASLSSATPLFLKLSLQVLTTVPVITVSRNSPNQGRQTLNTHQDAPSHGHTLLGACPSQSSRETQQQPVVPKRRPGQCHQRPVDRPHKE